MEHLYAPWRSAYFSSQPEGCVFCAISENSGDDEANQVLYRDAHCFVVMNRYPYTPGHFMVIPHQHLDALEKLDPAIWQHIAMIAQQGTRMLKEYFGAHGVNLGMNLGESAGAGIAEHLHLHLVPRFSRDTNFITTVGGARVNGVDFEAIYRRLLGVSHDYFN
jgi:diadenosine tetraphosphate (Ap4A) HIT family hydrolase